MNETTAAGKPGVVPENAILTETDTWSRRAASTFVANSGEYVRKEGFLARESPDSR